MSPRKKRDQDAERKEQIAKGEYKARDRHKKPKVEAEVPTPLRPQFEPLSMEDSKPVMLPITSLHPNPRNPNVMDDRMFSELAKSITEVGYVEAIVVAPIVDPADPRFDKAHQQYEIVNGEHRWEACKLLKLAEVLCVVHTGLIDQDSRDINLVRLNTIKGDFDPAKFTQLWDGLMEKYGSETTMELMGFTDEATLRDYILDAEESMPSVEAKREFQKQKKKIKTLEDLSRVVNNIFTKYGSTTELSFMSFEYGGHTHCIVWMDRSTLNIVEEITTFCAEHQTDINKVMQVVLTRGWDKTVPELLKEGGAATTGDDEVFDDEDDEKMDPDDPDLDPEGFGDDNPDDEARRVAQEIADEKKAKKPKKKG